MGFNVTYGVLVQVSGFAWFCVGCRGRFVSVVLRLCCGMIVFVRWCMGVRGLANFGLIWCWWFLVCGFGVPWWVVGLWFVVLVCRFWNVSLPVGFALCVVCYVFVVILVWFGCLYVWCVFCGLSGVR